MSIKVLIVEDVFIEANNLEIMLDKAGYEVCGVARSVSEAVNLIDTEKPNIALIDIQLKGPSSGTELADICKDRNIAFIYVSANSNQETLLKAKATQPYGFIVKPFREKDLMVTLEIAQYRHENSLEAAVRKEDQLRERLQNLVYTGDNWPDKMLHIIKALQPFLPFDYLTVNTDGENKPGELISYLRIGYDEYQTIGLTEFQIITNLKLSEINKLQSPGKMDCKQGCYSEDDFTELSKKYGLIGLISDIFKLKSLCLLPISLAGGINYNFSFYSRKPDAYNSGQTTLLDRLKNPFSMAMQSMTLNQADLTEKYQKKTAELNSKITGLTSNFEGIIGKSHLLLNVFDDIIQVAPIDTSVLILGESGTGKERIAQSIHNLSKRKAQPFIKINCAALPPNLVESELFGHERGAFTGATDKRLGKFERANGGTIFLDEIGDMPHDVQSKLLRVLQEKEIERVGGDTLIMVDVRVIAATNRNLEAEVAAGRFRLDLYYRLNIFPITLPALRDRKEDIPLLINHFITVYSNKVGKMIEGISERALNEALTYDWPGNIRELENLVERGILLSRDTELKELAIPGAGNKDPHAVSTSGNSFKSIDENEREHIIAALRQCKGKVWGAGGAAQLLNLPPSTLNSKMKKFDIKRDFC